MKFGDTKLGQKVPVPEMDEQRVAQLERAVVMGVGALSPTRNLEEHKWARYAVGIVAVAGVVLTVVLNLRAPHTPAPQAAIHSAETQPLPTYVVTGPGQTSQLLLGDAQVQVAQNTEVAVRRFADGRTVLTLASGGVHCEVEPRPNRPAFQVVSEDVTVTVIGTAFDVTRTDMVQVRVQRGVVAVATSYETLQLHAGEFWEGPPQVKGHVSSIAAGNIANGNTADDSNVVITAKKGRRKQNKTHRPTPPGDNTRATPAVPKAIVRLRSARPSRPDFARAASPEIAQLQDVFASDPATTAKALKTIAIQSTGTSASFALYSRAYLLLFSLEQPAEAAKAVRQYTRRFPRGAETEDMLWLGVRAQCWRHVSTACRTSAHGYLWRYPKGRFGKLASALINRAEE